MRKRRWQIPRQLRPSVWRQERIAKALLKGLGPGVYTQPQLFVGLRRTEQTHLFRTERRADGKRLVLKIDHKKTAKEMTADVRFMARISAQLADVPGMAAPEPLAEFADPPAVLMTEAPGKTLARQIQNQFPDARAPNMERAGMWILAFQTVVDRRFIRFDPARSMARIARLLEEPVLAEKAAFAVEFERLNALADAAEGIEAPKGLRHGDFHPGNLMMTETLVTGIDFGKRARGFAHRDLARLMIHSGLSAPALDWDRNVVRGAYGRDREAILAGYGPIPEAVMDFAVVEAGLRWWWTLSRQQPWSAGHRERFRRLQKLIASVPIER